MSQHGMSQHDDASRAQEKIGKDAASAGAQFVSSGLGMTNLPGPSCSIYNI